MKNTRILALLLSLLVVGAVAADPVAADRNRDFQFSKGNVWQEHHVYQHSSGDGVQINKNAQVGISEGGKVTQSQTVIQKNSGSSSGGSSYSYSSNSNGQVGVSTSSDDESNSE
jgi:hypothetical protein